MGKIRYRNPDTYESTGSFKLGHAWQRHEPGGDISLYQSPRAHSQSDFLRLHVYVARLHAS